MTDWVAEKIGFLIFIILPLFGLFKKLRDDKTLIVLLLVTGLITIFPIYQRILDLPYEGRLRGSDTLFLPFLYILLYGFLRMVYKKIYRREPTYYRASWYDPEDGRRQNIFDVAVFILPILLPVLLLFLIAR